MAGAGSGAVFGALGGMLSKVALDFNLEWVQKLALPAAEREATVEGAATSALIGSGQRGVRSCVRAQKTGHRQTRDFRVDESC